jgi:cytochrome d ubiquinol oxidase subunit I
MNIDLIARIQFAFTVMFHYIYPPLTIGLSVAMVIMEGLWLRTRQPIYHQLARFWTDIFALTFAIGVATGIVLEFEFGTNWATYSRFVGDIFGSALAAEGVFAFFLESGFLAILLFGWNKVGRVLHFFATCMVCFGAHFSTVWIVVANSWMQTPAGYHLERTVHGVAERLPPGHALSTADLGLVRAVIDDFWAMVFNPSSVNRLIHVVLGAWMAGAFLVVSISAYYVLRGRYGEFSRTSLRIGLGFATVATLLQMVSADFTARSVVKNQPLKLAAMEGVYETSPYTPITVAGWVDTRNRRVIGPKIPGMLSFLSWHDFAKPVVGLNQQPSDEFLLLRDPNASARELTEIRPSYWPNVSAVFQSYHLMVAVGSALFGLVTISVVFWWKGWLFRKDWAPTRWLLVGLILSVSGPQIANQAGWLTAELGRQPWIVYDLLKTSEAFSRSVRADEILFSILIFFAIYAMLLALFLFSLTRRILCGPESKEPTMEPVQGWRVVLQTHDVQPRTNP